MGCLLFSGSGQLVRTFGIVGFSSLGVRASGLGLRVHCHLNLLQVESLRHLAVQPDVLLAFW